MLAIENRRFTSMDYEAILARFAMLSDAKYRQFHESLIPGATITYGVRMPKIRAIAKEIVKSDPFGFLGECKNSSFEEIMLHGLVVSAMKLPLNEKLPLIAEFIPLIDNWGICDCFNLKVGENERQLLWEFLQDYFNSDQTYFIRFAVVTGMSNLISDQYTDRYLSAIAAITHENYYVKMAIAWALCECAIKQRDKTLALLHTKTVDKWTQNKAIQKCRESFRISAEDKGYLNTLKM
ncbi:hypothetical protein FACS189487_09610 [Campylobacterota bacterium]|nr:hypothetical protein FACS189487_09610 [Campylobacterota bacterium]